MKSWKGPENKMEGGDVQVGTCERPGRCQPSTLRKKIYVCLYIDRRVCCNGRWFVGCTLCNGNSTVIQMKKCPITRTFDPMV